MRIFGSITVGLPHVKNSVLPTFQKVGVRPDFQGEKKWCVQKIAKKIIFIFLPFYYK